MEYNNTPPVIILAANTNVNLNRFQICKASLTFIMQPVFAAKVSLRYIPAGLTAAQQING